MDCMVQDHLRLLSITGTGASPYMTLGPGIAQYVKGAVDL